MGGCVSSRSVPGYGHRVSDGIEVVRRMAIGSGFCGVIRVDVGGRTLLNEAYGLADRTCGVPMTVATRLGIASGSKAVAALTVMSLVADGTLTLATTARSLLGDDLLLVADDVTVEHLLAHRSGIGDYLDESDWSPSDYVLPVSAHRLATTQDFLPVLDGFPTVFPAGERFAYCNAGYVVLALLAERATGMSFHDLAGQRVLGPAGMVDSGYFRSDALPAGAALGYERIEGEWRTNVFHLPVRGSGDGGLYSTTSDMQRFWAALTAGRIVPDRHVAAMTRPSTPEDADGQAYGLGFWLRPSADAVILQGRDAGVSFRSVHMPSTTTTHTVIANTSDGAWRVSQELDSAAGSTS